MDAMVCRVMIETEQDFDRTETIDCVQRWFLGDQPHRLHGPAVINQIGWEWWHQYGLLHREDGPALFYPNSYEAWYWRGQCHRLGGPASTDHETGKQQWYQHGRRHCLDGPAIIYGDGRESWFQDGRAHRLCAPSITNNGEAESWFVYGRDISQAVEAWIADNQWPDWREWTPEIKALWMLWFAGR